GPFGLANEDKLLGVLPEVGRRHSEGFLWVWWGLILVKRDRWPEAVEVLTKGIDLPALVPVRRRGLTLLALAEWKLAEKEAEPAKSPWGRKAVGHLHALVAAGGPSPDTHGSMAVIAARIEAYDLARYFLDQGERLAPLDVALKRQRIDL